MKRFNWKAALTLVPILIMMGISIAFAADGDNKGNVWQTVTGVVAFLTTGAGAIIFRNLKVIKELREAIVKLMQAFTAVQIFVRMAPTNLKEIPEYVTMMKDLDAAAEEIADVLSSFKPTEKYATTLRNAIRESMYVKNSSASIEALRYAMNENGITTAFDEALAKLSKK